MRIAWWCTPSNSYNFTPAHHPRNVAVFLLCVQVDHAFKFLEARDPAQDFKDAVLLHGGDALGLGGRGYLALGGFAAQYFLYGTIHKHRLEYPYATFVAAVVALLAALRLGDPHFVRFGRDQALVGYCGEVFV